MFSSLPRSSLAQRAFGALDLARSFLLLEDDYEVDWEVDENEPTTPIHPHRTPLRRSLNRRPGGTVPVSHICLSPTENGQPVRQGIARAPREGPVPARRGSRAERVGTRSARDSHSR